jgi:hypothetical protein
VFSEKIKPDDAAFLSVKVNVWTARARSLLQYAREGARPIQSSVSQRICIYDT